MNDYLTVVGLSRTFRRGTAEIEALQGVEFSVTRGEYLAVVGRSGSGKTTLLHLLAGLDRPTAGEITLDGEPIHALPEHRLSRLRQDRVGIVFQDLCLVSGLNATDNIRLPLFLKGRLLEGAERATSLCSAVGLESRAMHFPAELSRGEAQRVAIARALVTNPDLLLVDEPTGSLDAESGEIIRDLFRRACREQGKTLIVATHDMELASDADRRIELRFGIAPA